ncbi:MAG: hypothetical protein V1808_00820 [Candidatus Daviesbacteria bacterium]
MSIELVHQDKKSFDIYSFEKGKEFLHLEIYPGQSKCWAVTWNTTLPLEDTLDITRDSYTRLQRKYLEPEEPKIVLFNVGSKEKGFKLMEADIVDFLNADDFRTALRELERPVPWIRVETGFATYYLEGGEDNKDFGMIGCYDISEEMLELTRKVSSVPLSEEEFSYVQINLKPLMRRFPNLGN